MIRKRSERGDVPVGCLVGLIVMGIALLIGLKVVPLMVRVGDLENKVEALADRAGRIEYDNKRIIRDILVQAEKSDLPVTKKDIKIERTKAYNKIWVKFTVQIDFIVYTYTWNKEIYENRPTF